MVLATECRLLLARECCGRSKSSQAAIVASVSRLKLLFLDGRLSGVCSLLTSMQNCVWSRTSKPPVSVVARERSSRQLCSAVFSSPVWPSGKRACLLPFAFFALAHDARAIADQFLPASHAHATTSTQTQCSGTVGLPTKTRRLNLLCLPLSAPRKHGFAREPEPKHHRDCSGLRFFFHKSISCK